MITFHNSVLGNTFGPLSWRRIFGRRRSGTFLGLQLFLGVDDILIDGRGEVERNLILHWVRWSYEGVFVFGSLHGVMDADGRNLAVVVGVVTGVEHGG